jgi:hypothetical protein
LLQPVDQVTLLYNITILEDSSFPRALNTQQHCPTPMPNSEASSRRGSIASINPPVENKHRTLSIIVKACPIIDGLNHDVILNQDGNACWTNQLYYLIQHLIEKL